MPQSTQTIIGQFKPIAVMFFVLFVVTTLAITYWTAKRTRTTKDFYAVGRSVIGFQNGLALFVVLMISYVLFGGMIATTWVQIIKAVLLLGGATLLVILTLAHFGFSYGELFSQAENLYSSKFLEPGGLVTSPIDAFSLGLALMFGKEEL